MSDYYARARASRSYVIKSRVKLPLHFYADVWKKDIYIKIDNHCT